MLFWEICIFYFRVPLKLSRSIQKRYLFYNSHYLNIHVWSTCTCICYRVIFFRLMSFEFKLQIELVNLKVNTFPNSTNIFNIGLACNLGPLYSDKHYNCRNSSKIQSKDCKNRGKIWCFSKCQVLKCTSVYFLLWSISLTIKKTKQNKNWHKIK